MNGRENRSNREEEEEFANTFFRSSLQIEQPLFQVFDLPHILLLFHLQFEVFLSVRRELLA